jgi:hypothetical protein
MESKKHLYQEKFSHGSKVQVADRAFLQNFLETWNFHRRLEFEQLNYAGKIAKVKSVGFCHGGDVLYTLNEIPGTWHEQCLLSEM